MTRSQKPSFFVSLRIDATDHEIKNLKERLRDVQRSILVRTYNRWLPYRLLIIIRHSRACLERVPYWCARSRKCFVESDILLTHWQTNSLTRGGTRETPRIQTASDTNPGHKRTRILSLGGDGIRVLSSLYILKTIMEQLGLEKAYRRYDSIQRPLYPCDYFDLFVGTGTGAICAILLGRLRMTVDEAIREYMRLTERVAASSSGLRKPDLSSFNHRNLRDSLDRIVLRQLGKAAAPMGDHDAPRTAVFAATDAHVDAPPKAFRSYNTATENASELPIAAVASAACNYARLPAAPGLHEVSYVNAAPLGHNNPTELALEEAHNIWGGLDIELVIYIGTGIRKVVNAIGGPRRIADAQKHIAAGAGDPTHHRVFVKSQQAGFTYHRLQIDRDLEKIETHQWKADDDILNTLFSVTDGYLRSPETKVILDSCVQAICKRAVPGIASQHSSWQLDDAGVRVIIIATLDMY
jgi:hypothetical protein